MKKETIKKTSKKEQATEAAMKGLDQMFKNANGNYTFLRDFLQEGDWWILTKQKQQLMIITHDAVKKIAREAGISTDVQWKHMTVGTIDNQMTNVFEARITDKWGNSTTGIGESSRNNLGTKGRGNPINMAQKRAYDRAVFDHLGIHGLLEEAELPDDEDTLTLMEHIKTDEEKKAIAPICNDIWAAKDRKTLMDIKDKVKSSKTIFSPEQMNAIQGLWKKQLATLETF